MNFELFIAKRISIRSKRSFSKLIVTIAITGIALGLAVMIAAMAIVTGFKAEIRDKMIGFTGHIQITKFDLAKSYENSAISRKQEFIPLFDSIKAITHIQVFGTKPGIINANGEIEGVVLKGVGTDYNWDFIRENLVSGRVPKLNDSIASNEVLVSKFTADKLRLKTGDKLLMYFVDQPMRKRKFEVSGIYSLSVEELDKIYIIGDIAQVNKLNNWESNQVGGFELFISDYEQLNELTEYVYNEIDQELNAYSVKDLYPQVFEWLDLLDVNAQVILVLMLLVAGINMISALLIMILERTNMIGLLKAMGSPSWSIRRIFLYNAAYLILYGMIIGNAIGIGFCLLQNQFHFIKLDQTSYYVSFVPVSLSVMHLIWLNIGTLVTCVLMLLIPSMLIAGISPLKAIRFK